MSTRIYFFLRQNVVGLIALFIALGGVSWAATAMPKNSVGSKQIKNGKVRSQDLRNGEVKWRDLAHNAITSSKVTPNSLTGEDIDEASLDLPATAAGLSGLAGGDLTGEYPDPSIASGAVNSAKVADNSLGGTDVNEASLDPTIVQSRITGSCVAGEAVRTVALNGSVSCEPISGGGPPTGPAGGELSGTYPNPTIAPGVVAGGPGDKIVDETITTDDVLNDSLAGEDIIESALDNSVLQARITGTCSAGEAVASVAQAGGVGCNSFPTELPPSGGAGGDLAGTYPNPTIASGAISGGTGGEITDETITTDDVLDDNLASADILDNALTGADIFDNSLSGADVLESGLDSAVLQSRVTGTCGASSAIASITQVGGVACNSFPIELPPSGPAGGDLTGTYPNPTITTDAVSSPEIVDLTRNVSLPLSGIVNCDATNAGAINFTSGVDTSPDFESAADSLLAMVWDVVVLSNDTDPVCSTLTVPADYVSGGQIQLVSTVGAAHDNDWAATTVRQNVGSAEDTTPTAATGGTNCDSAGTTGNVYVCSLTVGDTLSAGDLVTVSVSRAGGSDAMRLHGVEFRYTAAQ